MISDICQRVKWPITTCPCPRAKARWQFGAPEAKPGWEGAERSGGRTLDVPREWGVLFLNCESRPDTADPGRSQCSTEGKACRMAEQRGSQWYAGEDRNAYIPVSYT